MQLKSNNNACKTPNLAVCIPLTLTKWECIWKTTKHTRQENLKIRASKSSRTTWRTMKTHEKCKKNRNMQLTPNLKWDTRLKQEIFLDFMIL